MYYTQWRGQFELVEGEIASPSIGDRLSGGSTWHKEVANFTEYPILLKGGYDTTSNGRADAIVCPPHANIRRVSEGGSRDFASYVVEPLREIPDAFIDRVNFRG
jgi:hypothetical protein